MDKSHAIQEAAKRLDGARLLLGDIGKEWAKYERRERSPIDSYYRALLDAAYSFTEQLKGGDGSAYKKCFAELDPLDRRYLESLLSKRGSACHGRGSLLDRSERMVRAETVASVTVVGPLLPLTEEAWLANEAVGLPPGWLAGVIVPEYSVYTGTSGKVPIVEAGQRCVHILEQLLASFSQEHVDLRRPRPEGHGRDICDSKQQPDGIRFS